MDTPAVSKTAQVLKFFAQQYGRAGIPRKRLVKAAYMSDCLCRQYLGRPITELHYIKDHYGPNARELADFAEELESRELAQQLRSRDGEISWIRLRDSGVPMAYEFSLGEHEILAYVASNYLQMDIEEFITDVVKQTDPFLAAQRLGEHLPMDTINGSKREKVGFDLERVAAAERDAQSGKFVTLSQLADALRTQAASRYSI